jgi:hypothetical protein
VISDGLVLLIGVGLFAYGYWALRDAAEDLSLTSEQRVMLPPFARALLGGNSRGEARFMGCFACWLGAILAIIPAVRLLMAAL